MNYTHLGRTGLKVSRLCLGTMNFGDVTDEKTSARILDEALEAGINFIDTADVYGTEQSPDIQQGSGLSEEIIGRWLQQGGRRERIVLATKVYQPMGPGPNDRRLSAYHIRKACEDSLRRLKTDHIDVYQMHHIDRHTPWEEIWQAMELLVQQGKVLYIGSSNFAGWDIATAQSVATARHFYRHRKELLSFGIDINFYCESPYSNNVVPLVRTIEAKPAKIPSWVYEKGLIFDYVAYLLKTDSRFTVVSAPRLRVKNNASASFSVGSDVPVLGSVTVNNNTTTQSFESLSIVAS
ncbi:oxidoreductase [Klebsiella pneumoniae]|nr:oxidoreductase [Klebsiella pneumoniae]